MYVGVRKNKAHAITKRTGKFHVTKNRYARVTRGLGSMHRGYIRVSSGPGARMKQNEYNHHHRVFLMDTTPHNHNKQTTKSRVREPSEALLCIIRSLETCVKLIHLNNDSCTARPPGCIETEQTNRFADLHTITFCSFAGCYCS